MSLSLILSDFIQIVDVIWSLIVDIAWLELVETFLLTLKYAFIGILVLLIISIVYSLDSISSSNPLLGLVLSTYIVYTLISCRILYVVVLSLLPFLDWLPTTFCRDMLIPHFIDNPSSSTVFTLICDSISLLVYSVLPEVHAEEIQTNKILLHPSFDCVVKDTSVGGLLLNKCLSNLASQNPMGLPLVLTDQGQKASIQLISMLNVLPLKGSSSFAGDNLIHDYLSDWSHSQYSYNVVMGSSTLVPTVSYRLPLGLTPFPEGMYSGVYSFHHTSFPESGTGSTIGFRSRLTNHMRGFRSGSQYMHVWFRGHGGSSSAIYSPLICLPNVRANFESLHPVNAPLSVGGSTILMAFNQWPIRILEDAVHKVYSPALNPTTRDISFFNFNFQDKDMLIPRSSDSHRSLGAWSMDGFTQLAEGDSHSSLGAKIGLSSTSVRKYLNWHLGADFTIDGTKVRGLLREDGEALRTSPLYEQLHNRDKYMPLVLNGINLTDLTPHKVYAIKLDTLAVDPSRVYDSMRDLWLDLNPVSGPTGLACLTPGQQAHYLNTRINSYINMVRPGGTDTEQGSFYWARHPEQGRDIRGFKVPLFAVIMATGSATYYSNAYQVPGVSGKTIQSNMRRGSTSRAGVRYIRAKEFITLFPSAVVVDGAETALNTQQLSCLSSNL